ncbi:MAG TPA: hypothetical protein VFZ76_10605 [Anaerolineales bacterium]
MDTQRDQSGTAKWGWGILLAISVLVTLNGVGWFFIGPTLSTFEQDSGVPLAEFEGAYPTVAGLVSLQARNTAILLAGFGLLALAVALAGRRGSAGWPRWAGWAFVATLAGIGLSELAAGAGFGLFYLALGVAALAGKFLARR